MFKTKTKLLIVLAAVALVLGGGTYAIAQTGDEERTAEGQREALTRCSGGVDEGVNKVTNDTPTIINEGAFVSLAGAGMGAAVATGDSDMFQVVFHGEAELENASTDSTGFNNDDRLEIQALAISSAGTVTLAPFGPISFAGGNEQEAHAASWCVRLGPGNWSMRIQVRVFDAPPLSVVRAQLDDWELEVRRYN